jgi:hypothetical protein
MLTSLFQHFECQLNLKEIDEVVRGILLTKSELASTHACMHKLVRSQPARLFRDPKFEEPRSTGEQIGARGVARNYVAWACATRERT